jgi:hypothetical protein
VTLILGRTHWFAMNLSENGRPKQTFLDKLSLNNGKKKAVLLDTLRFPAGL